MSAPSKPWESTGGNFRSSSTFGNPGGLQSSSMGGQMPSVYPVTRRVSRIVEPARAAPPIPNRLLTNTRAPASASYVRPVAYGSGYGMGSYGTGYGSYNSAGTYGGYSNYAGYGGYGSGGYGSGGYGSYGSPMYGTGGYGMNRYPHQQQGINSLESRFIQMAEENSRPAFESIESLVQAFGSVSFMMESTFHAMYSSFRAVLGVAENFGRLRSLFGQVFQTFAVLRFFQWMYRKLLYYLGIRRENPGEAIWKKAAGQLDPKTRRTFWPVAMFLTLVCGGPFLVWRLLRSISIPPAPADSATNIHSWLCDNKSTTLALGVALYDFNAATECELTVKRGQQLWIAPQQYQTPHSDWLLVARSGKQLGHVPASYIQVLEHRKVLRTKPKQDPMTTKPPENLTDQELLPEVAGHQDPVYTPSDQHTTRLQAAAPLQSGPNAAGTGIDGQWARNEQVLRSEQTTRPGGTTVSHVAASPPSRQSASGSSACANQQPSSMPQPPPQTTGVSAEAVRTESETIPGDENRNEQLENNS